MQKKMSIKQVKQLIHLHLNQYQIDKIIIKHLSGLTNQTFKIQHQGLDPLVFRKFSPIYDRKIDNIIFKNLQKADIAPKCYFACQQYRIQGFIENSKHPSLEELKNKQLKRKIILHMKKFHQTQVQIIKDKPLFCQYILSNQLLEKIKQQQNISIQPKFLQLYTQVTKQYQSLDRLRQRYLPVTQQKQTNSQKIKFCHNDLNNLNIFSEPEIVFIDYDYCCYNFISYEIADFLNQSTINYTYDEFPFFKNQRQLTSDQILQAARLYPDYYEGLDKDIIKGLVLCNLYWAAWSILMTGDPSQGEFGTVEHGLMRLDLYRYYLKFV